VVAGVGVVALGVGTYFGLKSIAKANDARNICPKGICNLEQGATAADDAHSAAKIANVSFAIGAVAVATGAVLYFTLPTKHGAQVGVLPVLDPSSVGFAVRGGLDL
jgi:serine/threonine-protein kinase